MRGFIHKITALAKAIDAAFSKTVTGLLDAVLRIAQFLSDAFRKIVDYLRRLFFALSELGLALAKVLLLFIPTLVLWGIAIFFPSFGLWVAGSVWAGVILLIMVFYRPKT